MNRKELTSELVYNILGFGFYEGYALGEISALTSDGKYMESDVAQQKLEDGETINIYDQNEGKSVTKELTKEMFILETIRFENSGYPEDLKDFTLEQLDELDSTVQNYDYTTGATILEIIFHGEATYC